MTLASYITSARIIGAIVLLWTTPLSVMFFVIYAICCTSDFIDGYVARKTETTTRFGEAFDSIADFVFVMVLLIIFIPLFDWNLWMLFWIGTIATIRFLSLSIGVVKYRAVPFLHTYSNKATGITLALFPPLFWIFGTTVTIIILCGIASCSAIEELIIIIRSKRLNRNIKCLFLTSDGNI